MSRRWLRFGVKPQGSGLDLAGYSTAKLIRSEGSTTRLKSQTKRKQNSPPLMCCCVADAITNEYKFLKRHNEKFERLSTSVGQVRESLETLRRAFRPRPTSMIVRSFPRAIKSKRKNRRPRRQNPTYFPGRYDITVKDLLRRVDGAKI
jgi:hypothetical protein